MSTHDVARAAPPREPLRALWVIVSDPALSDAAVRLWLHYRRYHLGERGAYVSDPQTARALSWSTRKVQQVRAELHAAGYLVIIHRGPNPPSYYPILPGAASHSTASQASHSAVSQGREDSQEDSQKDSQNRAPVYKDEPVYPGEPEKQKMTRARGAAADARPAGALTETDRDAGVEAIRSVMDRLKPDWRGNDRQPKHRVRAAL